MESKQYPLDEFSSKYPEKYKTMIDEGCFFNRFCFYHPKLSFEHPITELLWMMNPQNALKILMDEYKSLAKNKDNNDDNNEDNNDDKDKGQELLSKN